MFKEKLFKEELQNLSTKIQKTYLKCSKDCNTF